MLCCAVPLCDVLCRALLCSAGRCEEQGFPIDQLSWLQGVAEELPLPDDSQDVVLSTLVSTLAQSLTHSLLLTPPHSALSHTFNCFLTHKEPLGKGVIGGWQSPAVSLVLTQYLEHVPHHVHAQLAVTSFDNMWMAVEGCSYCRCFEPTTPLCPNGLMGHCNSLI